MNDDDSTPTGRPGQDADSVEALARDLGRLARENPAALGQSVGSLTLRQQAELALRLPPRERLELLLHAPKPMQLVRSLPDAELYLTVREIGPHDALPLLALSSSSQIQHLLDLESWRRDRADGKRSGAWVALLAEAGEPTLRRFIRGADDELLVLLAQQWLRVKQIESDEPPEIHGHGLGEAGDERGFVSPDGNFHVSPEIPEHVPGARRLLGLLFTDQPKRYQRILSSAVRELPSEVEELALHWRQSRLEEHGFMPLEEALGVYAPPSGVRARAEPLDPERPDAVPASRAPFRVLTGQGILVDALHRLTPESRERALHELASVANRLMVADGADPGEPELYRRLLAKAAGYVEIALACRGANDAAPAGEVVDEIPLIELFREGWARAVELQQRARRLAREDWPERHPRALALLDPPIRQRVEALLLPRPMYLDLAAGAEEQGVRDFARLSEIEETRVALEMAEVVGGLLVDRLGLDIERLLVAGEGDGQDPPRFSALLLTVLAWHATRAATRLEPLPADVVADFLRAVASRRTAAPDAAERAMRSLLDDLARRTGLSSRERAVLGAFGTAALERLAAECGGLDPGTPPDPRFVSCLLLAG